MIMNSVNFKTGKKFRQSKEDLIRVKEFSNELCRQYGISETEARSDWNDIPKWKSKLRSDAYYAAKTSRTKEEFIEHMEGLGYKVKWEDGHKYITFTTRDGKKCRDNKLFAEQLLRENLEIYFALGGCDSGLAEQYAEYRTPVKDNVGYTFGNGLFTLLKNLLESVPPEEHYRHENFVPAIISREIWDQAQFLLSEKVRNNVRASSGKPCHRYTGLLKCADCGSSFSCKTRRWKNKPDRYEYVCNGYHRYGSENCTSHRIDEADLDNLIYEELMSIKEDAQKNYDSIESDVKRWLSQKNTAEKRIRELTAKLEQRKSDQQLILLERIRDREHANVYDEMLVKCDTDIKTLTEQIDAIKNFEETIRKRKAEIKSGIDMLDEIISEGAISNTHLRMLIKEILIAEVDGKLRIKIQMKAKFSSHIDFIPDDDDPMYQSMGPCLLER